MGYWSLHKCFLSLLGYGLAISLSKHRSYARGSLEIRLLSPGAKSHCLRMAVIMSNLTELRKLNFFSGNKDMSDHTPVVS